VLGLVEHTVHVGPRAVGAVQDLRGRPDEAAQDGLLLDDPGVVADVGRRGDVVDELGEVHGAAHGVELLLVPQVIAQRDEVDGLVAVGEFQDTPEDLAVGVTVEVGARHDLQHRVERAVLEQDPPEDGLLGLQVLGRHFEDGGIDGFHGITAKG